MWRSYGTVDSDNEINHKSLGPFQECVQRITTDSRQQRLQIATNYDEIFTVSYKFCHYVSKLSANEATNPDQPQADTVTLHQLQIYYSISRGTLSSSIPDHTPLPIVPVGMHNLHTCHNFIGFAYLGVLGVFNVHEIGRIDLTDSVMLQDCS